MNERIKQLAEQAGFMEAWFSESGDDCEREIKKFAELIVKECVEQIINRERSDGEWYQDDIFKHFGVEE